MSEFRTLLDAAAALRRKEVSAVELARHSLAAIERVDGRLNSFLAVMADRAVAQARLADEELADGRDRGPLHGIPVALKDLFHVRGVRTTGGSLLYTNLVAGFDSAVTERLLEAGAVLIGKTNLHELAYGITSNNPHFGAVRNPWDLERIPGGSSGGSGSAVAAGLVFMAMGSDTGGSIRIPASYCGTVGLKPTFGRVSRFGALPLGYTLDHMGPLARSVRDTAAVLNALAGYDPRDDASSTEPAEDYLPDARPELQGLRIGLPVNFFFEKVDSEVAQAVRAAAQTARDLGAHVVPVHVPDFAAMNAVARVILLSEAAALLEPHLEDRSRFGPDVLSLLDQGRLIPATDYINAQRLRRGMKREFLALFSAVDCLFTPTTPIAAPRIGQTVVEVAGEEQDVRLCSTRFVRAINLLGVPALALPCGFTAAGLPIGLQIAGRPFDEKLLLRIGAALEDATEFHRRRPPVL
jgi:aspartyl-tRNA(Asn)/glutamyl-tRNA(Gln) amidotransferase subunit A